MKFTKALALALCAIMVLAVLAGCKKNTNTPADSDAATPDSSNNDVVDTSETQTELNDKDTLDTYDFDGRDFNLSVRKATNYEYIVDNSQLMTSVQRQVFTRNQTIQDRFNIKLKYTETNCNDGHRTEYTTNLGNTMAGLAPHHVLSGHMTVISPQQYNGYLIDLCSLPEFDITKEWWSEELYNECNYNGKMYFAVGDIAYTLYEYLEVMFINESAFERNKVDFDGDIGEFYDMVRDGEWTMEMLILYSTNYASGLTDVPEDQKEYGLLLNLHSTRAFVAATEASFELRDGNGEVYLPETPDTRLSKIIGLIKDNLIGKTNILAPDTSSDMASSQNPIFSSGRALFYGQQLGQAQYFDMTDDYGIVPFPLYDDIQESYHTTIRNSVTAIGVPSNVADEDHTMIGVIVEALSMYGYQMVTPEYYGNVLSKRLLADVDGQEMLKLVRDTFTIDHSLANTFGYGNSHPYSKFKAAIYGEKDFNTIWAESYVALSGQLQIMKDNIAALDN